MRSRRREKAAYLLWMGLGILYCVPSGVVTLSRSDSGGCALTGSLLLVFLPDVSGSKCEAFCICEDVVEEYWSHPCVLRHEVFSEDVFGSSAACDDELVGCVGSGGSVYVEAGFTA